MTAATPLLEAVALIRDGRGIRVLRQFQRRHVRLALEIAADRVLHRQGQPAAQREQQQDQRQPGRVARPGQAKRSPTDGPAEDPQGLVAALFSSSRQLQARFLQEAQAGILKINSATTDADAETPFGGWKASGIGPPEHGAANREFYTRTQSIYGWEARSGAP